MPKDRRVNSLSADRAMMSCPYSCSLKNSESSNKSENSFVGGDEKEWEEARCPICIEHPHNAVLLICSSREKGCRPFMCDTSYRHSNCLDQFRKSSSDDSSLFLMEEPETKSKLVCPLCRGSITGSIVVEKARSFMDSKRRTCSLETCNFIGNYSELRKHAREKHPYSRPSVVSPTRELDWNTLENQRDIEDALAHEFDDDDYSWSGLDANEFDDDLWSADSFLDIQMSDLEDEFEDMFDFGGGSMSIFSMYLSTLEDLDNFDTSSSDRRPSYQRENTPSTPRPTSSNHIRESRNRTSPRSRPSYRRENTPPTPIPTSSNHIRESSNRTNPRSRPSYRRENTPSTPRPTSSNRNSPRSRPSYYYPDNNSTHRRSSRTRLVRDYETGRTYSRPRLSYHFDSAPSSSITPRERHGQEDSDSTGRYINGRRIVHAIREFPDGMIRQPPPPQP